MSIQSHPWARDMPHPHWSAADLASATPLRLSALFRFDADREPDGNRPSANQSCPRRGTPTTSYLPSRPLESTFRVH